jgi:tight adherence protein C
VAAYGYGAVVAAARVHGPLADEMRRVMREQSLGVSMGSALRAMAERTDAPSVRTFATTLVQGERLGISVGQMLRTLAVDIRKRRRALAEEKAHKTPVKILFPLVLLIFPALFIVLLAPAVLSVLGGFGNG